MSLRVPEWWKAVGSGRSKGWNRRPWRRLVKGSGIGGLGGGWLEQPRQWPGAQRLGIEIGGFGGGFGGGSLERPRQWRAPSG